MSFSSFSVRRQGSKAKNIQDLENFFRHYSQTEAKNKKEQKRKETGRSGEFMFFFFFFLLRTLCRPIGCEIKSLISVDTVRNSLPYLLYSKNSSAISENGRMIFSPLTFMMDSIINLINKFHHSIILRISRFPKNYSTRMTVSPIREQQRPKLQLNS